VTPSDWLFNGDEQVILSKLKGIILHNFDSPQIRVWHCIKNSIPTSVIFSMDSCKSQLVTGPNAGYMAIPNGFEDVKVIFWWTVQIHSENNQAKQCLTNAFDSTVID
jgi:hypothetical protein